MEHHSKWQRWTEGSNFFFLGTWFVSPAWWYTTVLHQLFFSGEIPHSLCEMSKKSNHAQFFIGPGMRDEEIRGNWTTSHQSCSSVQAVLSHTVTQSTITPLTCALTIYHENVTWNETKGFVTQKLRNLLLFSPQLRDRLKPHVSDSRPRWWLSSLFCSLVSWPCSFFSTIELSKVVKSACIHLHPRDFTRGSFRA